MTHVSIRVYTISGDLVTTVMEEEQQPNTYMVPWNGQNSSGEYVGRGLYFIIMKKDGEPQKIRKVIVR